MDTNLDNSANLVVGFTCGAFDLFHAGHNIMLRDCKTSCDGAGNGCGDTFG